ncbi:glycogen branching protein [Acinetobacter sp. Ac_3412]|uniref:beta-1,6-N-acetylglucosaminyltransferase n=1 Tax=Acinetobacter sp. Ac_3412 TaxID=1848935 RepID=UPI0014902F33|nr:beta-1,6-N-acetylglucosaminyltransferase [Acinetobacter sp. Ac_3412]NNP75074.1 glycogen branching protein [Acinetobacter sp. Ac_3412]
MNKVAILILAHKPIKYFEALAKENKSVNFFVHMDKKTNFENSYIENLVFLNDDLRVDVRWGGFSQVQATLNLFSFVIENTECDYIHLVSGEDILLSSNNNIYDSLTWQSSDIFMELNNSLSHRFRVRFFAPHVETTWQRKPFGKLLTFALKILDRILFTNKKFWFGSNWFSIRRNELKILLESISQKDINLFQHRLNPDEHFFQHLVVKSGLQHLVSADKNKRYIIFDKKYNNGNNPLYFDAENLLILKNARDFFFARKVKENDQFEYYEKVNSL